MSSRSRNLPGPDAGPRKGAWPSLRFTTALLAVALTGLGLAALFRGHGSGRGSESPSSLPPAPDLSASSAGFRDRVPRTALPSAGTPRPIAPSSAPAPPPPAAAVPGLNEQLVASLASLNPASGSLTPERTVAWKQSLQSLVQQGASAVPAIREFLARNTDVSFGSEAAAALGYGSPRAALVDVLTQIGGPEATTALVETLLASTDPRELAVLSQDLDKLAPDQFHDQAVQSARQLLQTMAANPGLLGDKDAAPLFEVLAKYGGAGVVPDLEQANGPWKYYSAIALAQLPDGAGIPSLIRMAQPGAGSSTSPQDPALRMLAQDASQYPEARNALLDLARQNLIPAYSWLTIGPILTGDQIGFQNSAFNGTLTSQGQADLQTTHIAFGNQNFYTAPAVGSWTPDQLSQQLDLIQKLLATASDPTAAQVLGKAYNLMLTRTPPPGVPAADH